MSTLASFYIPDFCSAGFYHVLQGQHSVYKYSDIRVTFPKIVLALLLLEETSIYIWNPRLVFRKNFAQRNHRSLSSR